LYGLENNGSKDHGCNTPGSAQRIVSRIVSVFKIAGQIGNNNGEQIQSDIIESTPIAKDYSKDGFDYTAKKIKGKHVQNQMHMILVNKSRSNKSIILTLRSYLVRIHHEFGKYDGFVKRYHAEKNSRADEDIRY
jgi:hypothetical protein